MSALDDPLVIEIILNDDGALWSERLGGQWDKLGTMEPVAAESAINTIAASIGTVVTRDKPALSAELPIGGERFQATIPPISVKPIFAIRKKPTRVFTLDDYEGAGSLSARQKALLLNAIANRKNILLTMKQLVTPI